MVFLNATIGQQWLRSSWICCWRDSQSQDIKGIDDSTKLNKHGRSNPLCYKATVTFIYRPPSITGCILVHLYDLLLEDFEDLEF